MRYGGFFYNGKAKEQKKKELTKEIKETKTKQQESSIYSSPDYPKMAKRQSELQSTLALFDDLKQIKDRETAAQEMVNAGGELSELANEELEELRTVRVTAEQALTEALTPKDPNDEK